MRSTKTKKRLSALNVLSEMVGRAGLLGFASPFGPLLTQRCLTSFDSNLRQVLIPHEFMRSTKTKKRLSALNVLSEMVGRAGFEPATN